MKTNRRHVIQSLAGSGLLLPGMLSELLAADSDPLSPKPFQYPAKAKRVIFMFMNGGISHVDIFDHKPVLNAQHNKKIKNRRYYKGAGWEFRPYGQCGTEVSDLFPHIGSMMDDICMLNGMQNINADHFGATIGLHTGSDTFNRPSIGSWISYGLGTENKDLPAFMVISPGLPYAGGQVWGSDFLPVVHQGTRVIPGEEPIKNMHRRLPTRSEQDEELGLLKFFNRQHLKGRESDTHLKARIKSFETAYGMQTAAPEAFDLRYETDATHDLYDLKRGDTKGFGWQCLVARRLAERGVRFIELIDGDTHIDTNWDTHANMSKYNQLSRNVDKPIAGLLKDLKQRGLFEDTLIVFATEFGRTPYQQNPNVTGRGHHSRVFSSWIAGAGIKGGIVHGSSDELGDKPAENIIGVHDLQATILHLIGIDHEALTYRHAGRNFRLTDVHGNVVHEILS